MKKSDFINAVAEQAELSKKDTAKYLDVVLNVITKTLEKNDSVNFIGFGSFSTARREAREAKIPLSGKVVKISARTVVKFKVGKSLKERIAIVEPEKVEKEKKVVKAKKATKTKK